MKTIPSQPARISANAVAITTSSSLQDNLRSLRLTYLLENAVPDAEQAARNGNGHLQYLEQLIAGEVALRHDRSVQRRVHDARFPVLKTMAGWDWDWPAKINRMQVEHLFELDFVATHSNVIFVGPTGVGKTHLATALGHAACLQDHSVLFAAAIDMVNRLSAAESDRQLAQEIKRYQSPRLLLIDELGYLPLDKRNAELLFQVITKRYERGSIIVTTNIAFKDWPRIFAGDATMTSALLDRLLHHAQPVIIEGDSYRSAKRKLPRSQRAP
ncbi:MAG: IS21-like element helper ATPase IstB [Chthoniobacterales bacterium]